jgi:hypothetical protein
MNDTSDLSLPKAATRRKIARQKVPPFARYEGTSAWKKDRKRVRAYARFRAAAAQ